MIATLAIALTVVTHDGSSVQRPSLTEPYRLVARLPKQAFGPDEPIPLTCDFSNLSDFDVIIWDRLFFCNHLVLIENSAGKEPALTKIGKMNREWFSPDGGPSKTLPVLVKAGTSYRSCGEKGATVDLRQWFHLPPGRYRLSVEHIEHRPPAMNLVSKPLFFEVQGKKAD